jgi:DNA-binding XRE family transcriptional regulator
MKQKNNVQKIMTQLGLSRAELAKALDMTTSSIYYYVKNLRHPSVKACLKIMKLAKSKGLILTMDDIRTF